MEETELKNYTAKWFEVKAKGTELKEDGSEKSVTRKFVVHAESWADAEATFTDQYIHLYTGDFDILDISIAAYQDIIVCDDTEADKWWAVKCGFISIDEKTEKEKMQRYVYLTNAKTIDQAEKNIRKFLDQSFIDYIIDGNNDRKITEVFI